jgi:hypothetical protein
MSKNWVEFSLGSKNNMIIDDEIHIHTVNLCGTHLGHALDLLRTARSVRKDTTNPQARVLSHRYSISSIIHSFAGLESAINYFGYEMFFHARSVRYIPPEQRSFLLRRFVQSWNNTPCIEKLIYIVTESGKTPISDKLQQESRELNTLRNWLMHGFSYTSTLLLQPKGNNLFDVADLEDSINWSEKFPQTKFSDIDSLSPGDATVALRIVLEVLRLLYTSQNGPLALFTISSGLDYHILFREKWDIDAILGK